MTFLRHKKGEPGLHPNAGLRRWEGLIGLLFLSPWIIGFLLFKLVPILASFWFSLTDFYMLEPGNTSFIGLANYTRFLGDIRAWSSLAGSLGYFTLVVPVEMIAALALAALFSSERIKGKVLLRPLFFLPSIIPAGAIFFIWLGFVDPGSGWISRLLLEPLGLPPLQDAYSPASYNFLLVMMSLWSIGPGFLIMLAAIQAIPKEVIEAARVDGAGPVTRFVLITLPIISPAIFFSLVINLTSAFGGTLLLDRGYLFSGSLSPMEEYINHTMFKELELGYAAALAWVMFLVTMSITMGLFRSARSWVYFPEEGGHETI
jgi:multiple sugar transport system permease protein